MPAAVERLLSMGATLLEAITERGPGFITASVVDPFGNVLGVMFNRHFLDVLGRSQRAAQALLLGAAPELERRTEKA